MSNKEELRRLRMNFFNNVPITEEVVQEVVQEISPKTELKKLIEKNKIILNTEIETNNLIKEQLREIEMMHQIEQTKCETFEKIEYEEEDEMYLEILKDQIEQISIENKRLYSIIEIFS